MFSEMPRIWQAAFTLSPFASSRRRAACAAVMVGAPLSVAFVLVAALVHRQRREIGLDVTACDQPCFLDGLRSKLPLRSMQGVVDGCMVNSTLPGYPPHVQALPKAAQGGLLGPWWLAG